MLRNRESLLPAHHVDPFRACMRGIRQRYETYMTQNPHSLPAKSTIRNCSNLKKNSSVTLPLQLRFIASSDGWLMELA